MTAKARTRRAPARRAYVAVDRVEGGGSLLVAAVALYIAWQQGWLSALTKPGALNPTSDENVAYQGANSVGSVLTDDPDFTLGGWWYDLTHPAFDATVGTGSSHPTNPAPLDAGVFIGAP